MKLFSLILGISLTPFMAMASNKTPKIVWSVQIIDLETGKENKLDIDTKAGKFDKQLGKDGFVCNYTAPISQNSSKAIAMKRIISCSKEGDKYTHSSASICAAVNGVTPANSAANIIISDEKESKGFSLSMVCHLENE